MPASRYFSPGNLVILDRVEDNLYQAEMELTREFPRCDARLFSEMLSTDRSGENLSQI